MAGLRIDPQVVFDISSTDRMSISDFPRHFLERCENHGLISGGAIYSRQYRREDRYWLRSSTIDHLPRQLVTTEIDNISQKFHCEFIRETFRDTNTISKQKNPGVLLAVRLIGTDKDRQVIELVRRSFIRAYSAILAAHRTRIRSAMIKCIADSRDLNSFLYRAVNGPIRQLIGAEGSSVFLVNPRTLHIGLATTTGLRERATTRADVNFAPEAGHPVVVSSLRHRVIISEVTSSDGRLGVERFDDLTVTPLRSRAFIPLRLQEVDHDDFSESALGSLRVSNMVDAVTGDWRPFAWEDLYLLAFVAEVMSVLILNYMRAHKQEQAFERAVHGTKGPINSTILAVRTIRTMLLGGADSKSGITPLVPSPSKQAEWVIRNIGVLLDNAEAMLDDCGFQIEKSFSLLPFDKEIGVVHKLRTDVLDKALGLCRGIAVVHDSLPPKVEPLSGEFDVPPVIGDSAPLIAVFRNLFENAIKYCGSGKPPEIELSVSVGRELVVIGVRDQGIGIPARDFPYLFREGFRGARARKVSNKGAGIGLAYSRELMQSFSGDLRAVESPSGAHFEVILKRASGSGR